MAEVTIGYRNGKRHRKSYYFKTRKEAAQKLIDVQKALKDGLPLGDERLTVGSFLDTWLQSAKPSLRPSTWERYGQLLRLHAIPEIGRVRLVRLQPSHLRSLYAKKLEEGLATGTVANLHRVIHRALRDAAEAGEVGRNVASLVRPVRPIRKSIVSLSKGQVIRLLSEVSKHRLEALFVLAVTTGMRRGELFALQWADVDLDRASLRVRRTLARRRDEGLTFSEPKSKQSRRQIALSQIAVQALRRHRIAQAAERLAAGPTWDDMDLVFANQVGKPIEPQNFVVRDFHPLVKRAGLPSIRFHDLRHTAATLLLEEGIHPKIVSEMLGHSQIAITLDLYSHVTPTMQQSAASALDRALGEE